MNAKKQQPDESSAALVEAPPKRRSSRGMIVSVVVLTALAMGWYAVWQQVRAHVLSGDQYAVDPQRIAITPPPAWIHADIKDQVMRDVSLQGPLSLLDNDLTLRMAGVFSAHPWIAHVERVSKHFPAGLDVALSYRQPVAMVEIEDGTSALPVDRDGVVLPTEDFKSTDAEMYPRIGEIHTAPTGPVGAPWGDDGVVGAAQIAAALGRDWKELGIFRIVPAGHKPGRTGAEPVFNLITTSGSQIHWGRAPGSLMPGEVPAAEKIAQLKRYAAQNNGSLDLPDGAHLEIRDDGALLARPRREIKPLPKKGE